MKIGIVTFYHNYNYGSVLQCYALQSILEDLGCKVEVLNQKETGYSWKIRSFFIKLQFIVSCFIHRERFRKYLKFIKESNRSCDRLSPKVKADFDCFLKRNINDRDVSFRDLCKDKSSDMFVCGSDQVWSLSAPMLNPFMFLRFASKNKRASYAASTGTQIIPIWYKKKLKKYINGFRYISIRESLVIPSLIKIGCKNIQQHIDPTLLMSADFWLSNSVKSDSIKEKEYLLLFFLNRPSSIAIEHIKSIVTKSNLSIYSFPYVFDEFNIISENIKSIEVSPSEFAQVLNNATVIFTDSFHGVAFSINLKKEFYVYDREYSAGTDQSSRIDSILNQYGLEVRKISNPDSARIPLTNYDLDLKKDRSRSIEYVKTIIV